MLNNRFNLLLAPAETQPRPGATGSPAATSARSNEGSTDDGDDDEGEDGDGDSDDSGGDGDGDGNDKDGDSSSSDVAEAAEQARPPQLTAFQRGSLRALGMGKLIARVEKAEGDLAVANATIDLLKGEVKVLKADAAGVPAKVEAAKKIRAKEVSSKVTDELKGLGISAEDAPALNQGGKDRITTREAAQAAYLAATTPEAKREVYLTHRDLLV